MRLACSNTYDDGQEPDHVHAASLPVVEHNTFTKMMHCIFKSHASDPDVIALLKRANVVLFGARRVYLRLASATPCIIPCIEYPPCGSDLRSNDCKERFSRYKEGEVVVPEAKDMN